MHAHPSPGKNHGRLTNVEDETSEEDSKAVRSRRRRVVETFVRSLQSHGSRTWAEVDYLLAERDGQWLRAEAKATRVRTLAWTSTRRSGSSCVGCQNKMIGQYGMP